MTKSDDELIEVPDGSWAALKARQKDDLERVRKRFGNTSNPTAAKERRRLAEQAIKARQAEEYEVAVAAEIKRADEALEE